MALLENWFNKKANDKLGHDKSRGADAAAAQQDSQAARRRQKRMARRELLYAVVREAMARAGVLSSHYSFKVLSLEPLGRQYIVMVDLLPDGALSVPTQRDTEKQIAHAATIRHGIQINAIYWRHSACRKGAPDRGPGIGDATMPPRFEPIGADEVAALRQALAIGMSSVPNAGFEDTEVIEEARVYPALSKTQYGDLN